MTYGVLVAESEVLLAVALGDLNGIVDVLDGHGVVGDVLHTARATATLQVGRQSRSDTGPDLDASTILDILSAYAPHCPNRRIFCETYRCVEHGDVVDQDVLNDVDFVLVLAQRTNGDTVRAVAVEVLNDDVGAVGLEGNTVYK